MLGMQHSSLLAMLAILLRLIWHSIQKLCIKLASWLAWKVSWACKWWMLKAKSHWVSFLSTAGNSCTVWAVREKNDQSNSIVPGAFSVLQHWSNERPLRMCSCIKWKNSPFIGQKEDVWKINLKLKHLKSKCDPMAMLVVEPNNCVHAKIVYWWKRSAMPNVHIGYAVLIIIYNACNPALIDSTQHSNTLQRTSFLTCVKGFMSMLMINAESANKLLFMQKWDWSALSIQMHKIILFHSLAKMML